MQSFDFQVNLNFPRPDKALVEQFRGMAAANVGDCLGRMAALSGEIRPMSNPSLLGTAFTVRVPEGDNLMLHKAMDLALPGDIIIVATGGVFQRAMIGELMASYCEKRGIGGLVIDGAIRDAAAVATMSIPIYARGTSPNGPYKEGPGEIGTTVAVGGQTIPPGEILLGDGDGIVVIRPREAAALVPLVRAVEAKETAALKSIRENGVFPRPWVDEALRQKGCAIR
jgi:regulator of RNase E activity RraA